METLNATLLIKNARQKLEGRDARRMAVIHTGVAVAVALVSTALQYVLQAGVGNTSGLSGIGTRSVLETIQTVLHYANMLLTPFWGLGFLYVALLWAKGEYARKEDLLTGFHRFGSYLGLTVSRGLLVFIVAFVTMNLSSIFYMITPAAAQITELATASGGDAVAMMEMLEQMPLEQTLSLTRSLIPALVIWAVLCIALLIPLLYRFRMAEYVILENKGIRGLAAMLVSAALLRRRCWQLFRLDLKFWWYYGMKLLCTVLCYGDLLLETFGVTLPVGSDAAYFGSYLLYLLALFAVEVAFRPQVDTAYALTYVTLKEMAPITKPQPEKPKNLPWDEE